MDSVNVGNPLQSSAVGSPEGAHAVDAVLDQIDQVVMGKRDVARLVLTGLVARGHVLLVDVPGVAKTRLARAFARSLALSFQRIQATPDLLPGDVVGVSLFDPKTTDFVYRPGPVLNHIVLVDEVNRATPRTQAALLECMEERQVTVDGVTRPTPDPFMVLATENPVEMEGTYPLPEAQLDRFLLAVSVGYPEEADELTMMRRLSAEDPLPALSAVATSEDVRRWQREAHQVRMDAAVEAYLLAIVRNTRIEQGVRLGASPRATLALTRAARAYAYVSGRSYVLPDDIKTLAAPVLGHRLLLAADAAVMGESGREAVARVVASTAPPTEAW
jgi:MoxR-like ATPase